MERLQNVVACTMASIFGAMAPIEGILDACMIVFATNFVAGFLAGLLVQKDRFAIRKAMNCILEATVITTLIAMILVIGDKIDNREGAMSAISVVVYALIYFYGVNILKNLTRLFPANKLLEFLYYVISFEVVEKIPYLSNYTLNKSKNNTI